YVQGDDQGILTGALAKLWVAGTAPDWRTYYAGERRRRIPLPTYAFERQRYWIDAALEDASLAQQLLTQSHKSKLEDAFYVPSWSTSGELSVELNTPERAAGLCWLIFADTDGIGDALAAAVGPLGVNAVLVRRGDAFSTGDDGAFFIRASEKDDYITLLKELKRGSRIPSRIVHLWAAEYWEEPPGD